MKKQTGRCKADILRAGVGDSLYRIFSIARYEVMSDIRESRLGILWDFLSPLIQVATYWFVFGYVLDRSEVDGIDYISWMLAGMCMWFFLRPCISNGCSAVYRKAKLLAKMKFPVYILPAVTVTKEAFHHACFLVVTFLLLILKGHMPQFQWFFIIYYFACAYFFCISLSLVTSVLTMFARDIKRFIDAILRLLMYLTPILWSIERLPKRLQAIVQLNPLYYPVTGYRDVFFYHRGIAFYGTQTLTFWIWTIGFFTLGSVLMYRFRKKFADLI